MLTSPDNVVGAIIARAEATGVESDEELLEIYLQLERARFWDVLAGDLVVPIILTDFGSEDPIDLGGGVRIERLFDDCIVLVLPIRSSRAR